MNLGNSASKKIEILDAISKHYGFTKRNELADFLGISAAVLSNWYSRDTLDYEIIIEKCKDVDLNILLKNNKMNNDDKYYTPSDEIHVIESTPPKYSLLSWLEQQNEKKDRKIEDLTEKLGQLKEQLRQLNNK